MTVRCPNCRSEQALPAAGISAGGRIVRCDACGTRWMARPYEGLLPLSHERAAISDAVVVEDRPPILRLPPPPVTRPPPSWRRNPVDRRLRAFGIVVGILTGLAILGAPIVSALPEMRRLSVDAGLLEFQKVRSETVSMRGVRTLFVEGEIVNRSGDHVAIPAIRIALKSADGTEVSSWLVEIAAESLPAGRAIGFRSALASPPPDASQVTLNLAEREGLAGIR